MAATGAAKKAQIDEVASDNARKIESLTKFRACLELEVDGTMVGANELFLKLMGYGLEEIKGKNHSMFVDEADRRRPEYAEFWASLGQGIPQTGEYRRVGKGGKPVWLASTYYPIVDLNGQTYRVLQFATDVTAQKLRHAECVGQVTALRKSLAVIEYKMDGTIIDVNENFEKLLGYTRDELMGKNASVFSDEASRNSAADKEVWAKLNRGEFHTAEVKKHRQRAGKKYGSGFLQPHSGSRRQALQGRELLHRPHPAEAGHRRLRRPDRRHRQVAGHDRVQDGRHRHHRQRQLPEGSGLHAG